MNTLKSELRKLEKNKHLAYIKFKEERSKLFEAGDWNGMERLQFEFKADEIELERQIEKLEDIHGHCPSNP